jgi:hypothetical protein
MRDRIAVVAIAVVEVKVVEVVVAIVRLFYRSLLLES